MATRRKFLKILGGGTILAAAGGGGFVATRTPTAALAPWMPATYDDPRKAALSHAILAPSPHNRQPWLIELVGEDTVRIHRDPDRDLPETDPFHRQLYIGLGAFVETMVIAASGQGQTVELTLLPEGEDGPVAEAVFSAGGTPNPLAAQILTRHSNKKPYSDQRLSDAQIADLGAHTTLIVEDEKTAPIRAMTKRAFEIEVYTPAALKESVDLMRIGKAEINANPDGIEMREPLFEVLRRTGLMGEDLLMNTEHPANVGYLRGYLEMLEATPHFAAITTPANTRADQLDAGRKTVRLYLKANELGIGIHPVSQALQEYREMAEEYALAHELLAPTGHTVQMLMRVGFGPDAIATPRWPLESRILDDEQG